MSFVFTRLQEALRHGIINKAVPVRCFTRGTALRCVAIDEESATSENNEKVIDPRKDRRKQIPLETGLRYIASDAYKETYGNDPVWKLYRRNHKGALPPRKTRKTCIRQGMIATGSPCPICRDEYLVLDYRNVTLLKQFISEHNGEVLSYSKTCLCQRQHQNLLVAILRAKDYGTLTFDVPLRRYDYGDWYKAADKAN